MNEDDCWCEYVDIGVGMQRVTEEPGCPQHMPCDEPGPGDYCPSCRELNYVCAGRCTLEDRLWPHRQSFIWPNRQPSIWPYEAASGLIDAFKVLAPVVLECARVVQRSTWALSRPCACPTPTHRMSCGQGATPKVVAK